MALKNSAGISVFLLVKADRFLVEKRPLSKVIDPGKTVIPAGMIESGESPLVAAKREARE